MKDMPGTIGVTLTAKTKSDSFQVVRFRYYVDFVKTNGGTISGELKSPSDIARNHHFWVLWNEKKVTAGEAFSRLTLGEMYDIKYILSPDDAVVASIHHPSRKILEPVSFRSHLT